MDENTIFKEVKDFIPKEIFFRALRLVNNLENTPKITFDQEKIYQFFKLKFKILRLSEDQTEILRLTEYAKKVGQIFLQ